jgi:hypothetical protein
VTITVVVGSSTPTTNPGAEITIVGGPNVTSNLPGAKSDPADFYGIIAALLAIGIAIALARWIFGRRGSVTK